MGKDDPGQSQESQPPETETGAVVLADVGMEEGSIVESTLMMYDESFTCRIHRNQNVADNNKGLQ